MTALSTLRSRLRPFRASANRYARALHNRLRLVGATANRYAQALRHAGRGEANLGYCVICQRPTVFYQREKWLREHYLCIRCGSIPRFRSLILVLDQTYPDWRDLRIFESSPAGASSNKIARECRRYVSAHFFPEIPLGESRNGIRCENIEKMTFPDSSFDLVVTQDVLEHVFHPDAAFREIARILAPGGAHIFTTPVLLDKQTVVRAVEEDGNVKHLLPPQYHGNPIDPEGSLVVRDWGGDIVAYIKASSGLKTEVLDFDDPRKGLVAEYLQVFVTRRPL